MAAAFTPRVLRKDLCRKLQRLRHTITHSPQRQVTALSGKSNTYSTPGSGETGWLIGQLFPSGLMNLVSAPPDNGNDAYETVGVCAFNTSAYYTTVIGGSQNANNVYYWAVNPTSLVATATKIGVSGQTTMNFGASRGLACSPTGWGVYLGWETGVETVTVGTTPFSGGMVQFAGFPTGSGVVSLLTPSTYTRLVANTLLAVPRGFLVVPGIGAPRTNLAATVWAVDYTAGLFRYTLNGTAANTYNTVGPFTIAGDTGYQGVALSVDNSTAYVTANKGVYAFAVASLTWLSTTPVALSVSTVTGDQGSCAGGGEGGVTNA